MLKLERAQALIGLRRFDDAASLLQELVGADPEVAPAWCLLAQAQIGLGEMESALECAERAAVLAPDDDWPHRLRSIALEDLGDAEGAIAAAREAVAKAPQDWRTHNGLATQLLLAKRDLGEAEAAAELAVALAPHEPSNHLALGSIAQERGNRKEAEEHFRNALALDPQNGPSHAALAARKLRSSRFGRAGTLADAAAGFRTVVQADPTAGYAVKGLETTLRVFVARLSYLVFVIVWFASRTTGGTAGDRIAPLVFLAVPAVFAARFLARLAPDLRREVRHVAFHGRLAPASYAQALGVALLFVSALAPAGARTGIGIAALVASAGARLLLARSLGGLRFSATSVRIVLGAVVLLVLYFVGATVGGGFSPVRGLSLVAAAAVLTLFYYLIRRRRRA